MSALAESALLAGDDPPLLAAEALTVRYGRRIGCRDVDLTLWPGEVLAIVGESGSGKTTVLNCLAGLLAPDGGRVVYRSPTGGVVDVHRLAEGRRRLIQRTEWGIVFQNPRDGLRLSISAGGNIGERLMAIGHRHYGRIRDTAADWLARVEIEPDRLDDPPAEFSGGMQQRLQIARNLVSGPRVVFMDEPTGGLDVSVQARLLDLLRRLVAEMHLAAVLVTHDLAAARLLADRIAVMHRGRVVESGLTDQVLDDPQEPYTQLLVSSVLRA